MKNRQNIELVVKAPRTKTTWIDILNVLKKPIDVLHDVLAPTIKSILNALKISAKYANELMPLFAALASIFVYGLEIYQIKTLLKKAIDKKTTRYRSMKLVTNTIILCILGAGLGTVLTYGLAAFGIVFAGITLLPIIIPALLALSYGVALFRESYKLHHLKNEKQAAKDECDKAIIECGKNINEISDHLLKIRNEKAILLKKLCELTLARLKIQEEILEGEICKIKNSNNQNGNTSYITTLESQKLILRQRRLKIESLEKSFDEITNLHQLTADAINKLNDIDSKIIKAVDVSCDEKDNDISSALQQFKKLKKEENKLQQVADKFNHYQRLEYKTLKSERAVAYKSIEVFASLIGVAGIMLGVLGGASFGVIPLCIIMTGVLIGLGIKIYEKLNDTYKKSLKNKAQHTTNNLFKKRSVNQPEPEHKKNKSNNSVIHKMVKNNDDNQHEFVVNDHVYDFESEVLFKPVKPYDDQPQLLRPTFNTKKCIIF